MFLAAVVAHRLVFVGWRPKTEFGLGVKERCRLLSLTTTYPVDIPYYRE